MDARDLALQRSVQSLSQLIRHHVPNKPGAQCDPRDYDAAVEHFAYALLVLQRTSMTLLQVLDASPSAAFYTPARDAGLTEFSLAQPVADARLAAALKTPEDKAFWASVPEGEFWRVYVRALLARAAARPSACDGLQRAAFSLRVRALAPLAKRTLRALHDSKWHGFVARALREQLTGLVDDATEVAWAKGETSQMPDPAAATSADVVHEALHGKNIVQARVIHGRQFANAPAALAPAARAALETLLVRLRERYGDRVADDLARAVDTAGGQFMREHPAPTTEDDELPGGPPQEDELRATSELEMLTALLMNVQSAFRGGQ